MRRRPLIPLLWVHAVLMAVAAAAGADDEYWKRPGWFVGATGLYGADFFEKDIEKAVGGLVDVKDTGGLNAYGGYRLTSWFAVEGNFEWMSNFAVDTPFGGIDYETESFTANAKLFLPVWRVQPYLNLGVGTQYYDMRIPSGLGGGSDSGWGFLGRPGVGIDFFVTRSWVINAQLNGMLATQSIDKLGRNVGDLFYVSTGAGVQYRF